MKRVKTGHSARRGNAPSPYHKYGKRPFKYGEAVAAVYRKANREGGTQQQEPKRPAQ